jgi:kojibiose phosphorylase
VTPRFLPDSSGQELIRIWTGDLELHVTSDVAYAIWQYWQVTGDDRFMRGVGAPILLETARFWESRMEEDEDIPGRYSISDVIGPDEYHEHVDNNVFTNRMVAWHLQTASEVLAWLERVAGQQAAALRGRLELTAERLQHWQEIAEKLVILHDPETGLYEQFEGFFKLPEVDWRAHAGRTTSMQELLGIEETNRRQVLKQPDVLLLLCLLREQVTDQVWRANWDYYVPRTDHSYGSSLGPAIHAWAACELGRPDEAYEHFMRAARADLQDVRGNAGDGIHAASAGAIWQALVFGFAGLQVEDGGYRTRARLPAGWQRLAFTFYHRDKRHKVDLRRGQE